MLLVGQGRHNQWFLVLGWQKRRWVVVLLLSMVLWVPEMPLLRARLFLWPEAYFRKVLPMAIWFALMSVHHFQ